MLSLLAEAAEERPLLCVIDDAQWLDTPSADALVFTARRVGAEGIAVLFAVRDGERRQFAAPGIDELVLAGLDHSSARVLLDRATPKLAPAVRERLLEDAAGNPLALLELPAGLSDVQLAGRALLPDAIPLNSRLQAAFSQRVERLPDSTQAALLLAAAEADGEPAIVLRAVAALGLASESLDAAERAGLINASAERLSFRHPLVRSAVYESATLAERRRAHAALAEACSEPEHADRRVWHSSLATIGADEEIAVELEASAERLGATRRTRIGGERIRACRRLSDTDHAEADDSVPRPGPPSRRDRWVAPSDLVHRALPLAESCGPPASARPQRDHRELRGLPRGGHHHGAGRDRRQRGSVAEPSDAPGRVWHDRIPGRLREDA